MTRFQENRGATGQSFLLWKGIWLCDTNSRVTHRSIGFTLRGSADPFTHGLLYVARSKVSHAAPKNDGSTIMLQCLLNMVGLSGFSVMFPALRALIRGESVGFHFICPYNSFSVLHDPIFWCSAKLSRSLVF